MKKSISIASIISVVAVIAVVIGLILLGVVMAAGEGLEIASGSQPFYDFTRPEDSAMKSFTIAFGIVGAVLLVASVVLGQIEGGKILKIVADVLKILAPAALLIAALYFVFGSFTGLGWTYFSNAELQIYPEAIALGGKVITGIVFSFVAAVLALVASFLKVDQD